MGIPTSASAAPAVTPTHVVRGAGGVTYYPPGNVSPSLTPSSSGRHGLHDDFPAQSGPGYVPADGSVSASSNYVVEVVNSEMTVYQHSTSGTLLASASLLTLSGLADGASGCIDPTTIYWSWDSRFGISCIAQGGTDNEAVAIVSQTSSPIGLWCSFRLVTAGSDDQDSMTVTADKLVIGGRGPSNYYFYAYNKSQMLTCGQVAHLQTFTTLDYAYRAAVHYTNEFDAKFVTLQGAGVIDLAVLAGSPGSVSLAITALGGDKPPSFRVFTDIPDPGGTVGARNLDGRILDAVQELRTMDNHYVMYFSFMQQCSEGSYKILCGGIMGIDFTSSPTTVNEYWTTNNGTGQNDNIIFPAVSLDGYGNVFVASDFVSPSNTPEALEQEFTYNDSHSNFYAVIYGNTPGTTSCGDGTCDERWGDYFGGFQDPDTTHVWFMAQYQKAFGDQGWGTVIAEANSSRVL
jgi:hypothetical protein